MSLFPTVHYKYIPDKLELVVYNCKNDSDIIV